MDTKNYLNGNANDAYTYFGPVKKDKGYIFRIAIPGADKVEIIGDFNDWKASKMRGYSTGVFSITIKNAKAGDRYQFVVTEKNGNQKKIIDPFAQEIILEENCSVITDCDYKFKNKKIKTDKLNIYEVHLGSFLKASGEDIRHALSNLIAYVKGQNFTHIKFMPVNEYKNYKSMGFASIGLFAFSNRYGSALDFKDFVDTCHKEEIAVILDLDLGHFDPDPYYLSTLDRFYSYDHDDIKYSYYGDMNFDPEKNFTKSYLKSLINFWLKEYNIDGIMLTNIENMIYWQGDEARGENEAWILLLEDLINEIHKNNALALGSFNGIYNHNIDFDYVLDYSLRPLLRTMQRHPYKRDANKLQISKIISDDNSNKILGFNYLDSFLDEASLLKKLYGNEEKYRQFKSILTFIYSLNSKKLLFNGSEIGNENTFSVYEKIYLDNISSDQEYANAYYKDISKLYLDRKELNNIDSKTSILDVEGYSLYGFIREYKGSRFLVLVNLTDIDYVINSPYDLQEIINSSDLKYGGSGNINGKINKNEKILIEPFGSSILKVKNDEN